MYRCRGGFWKLDHFFHTCNVAGVFLFICLVFLMFSCRQWSQNSLKCFKTGKQLLKMKTHNHKLAIDFAQTEEMQKLLLQESFGTYNFKDINQNIYENVTLLHSSVIEEYLYLLERLISVYTPTKQCVVRQSELINQLELFKEHIWKISDRQTLKIKLYINSIAKSLISNRSCNI